MHWLYTLTPATEAGLSCQHFGQLLRPLQGEDEASALVVCSSSRSTGKVSTSRARIEEPPSNQVARSLNGWLGQDLQGAASEGSHPHPTNHPSLNRDGSLELPCYWMAALKSTSSRTDQRPMAPTDGSSDSSWWDARLYTTSASHSTRVYAPTHDAKRPQMDLSK